MLDQESLRRWFCAEILPLERPLTRYIARNWRNGADVADLRQEIYARVIEGVGRSGLPLQAKPYLFTTARNHLINCARRGQIISLESVLDLASTNVAARLGITVGTVEQQMVLGMRAVVDFMLGGTGRLKRPPSAAVREAGQ